MNQLKEALRHLEPIPIASEVIMWPADAQRLATPPRGQKWDNTMSMLTGLDVHVAFSVREWWTLLHRIARRHRTHQEHKVAVIHNDHPDVIRMVIFINTREILHAHPV